MPKCSLILITNLSYNSRVPSVVDGDFHLQLGVGVILRSKFHQNSGILKSLQICAFIGKVCKIIPINAFIIMSRDQKHTDEVVQFTFMQSVIFF